MHVAVVGAGPAGSWTAYQLARRGARVTIFDGSHPREKPCGGGVTGRALALVADAIDVAHLDRIAISSARFVDSHRDAHAVVALASDALTVSSRASFDRALLDAAIRAGAAHHTSRVVSVDVSAHGVNVSTREGIYRADFLVGADGANSLVKRSVAAPFPKRQLSIATGFFARGRTSHEIVLEMVADPRGYIWSFPRPDHLAIGICTQADEGVRSSMLRAQTAAWIQRTRIADGATLEPYAWPIPSLDRRGFDEQIVAGDRWCLVGDAAGLVDPITREGIFYAIASAEWAADCVTTGGDAAARYRACVHDEAVTELVHAARLKAGFFRQSFTGLLLDALQNSARIRAIMADLVAGTQPYRSLKWRLARTLELGLAWRVLRSRSTSSAAARPLSPQGTA